MWGTGTIKQGVLVMNRMQFKTHFEILNDMQKLIQIIRGFNLKINMFLWKFSYKNFFFLHEMDQLKAVLMSIE